MFRALQQAPKSPMVIRPPTTGHVHGKVPYVGPPSYETIRRRLSSSEVNLNLFFTRKRQQEAYSRGEYVEIHDISVDPNGYDVLLTDITHEALETTIAEELGMPYLSKAGDADAEEVVRECSGYIHGSKYRVVVPLVVCRKEEEARWVFFVVDSGAPLTYLSAQTSKLLGVRKGCPNPVKIGGYDKEVYMSPPNSRFSDVNILGGDFCTVHKAVSVINYRSGQAKLFFGREWKGYGGV